MQRAKIDSIPKRSIICGLGGGILKEVYQVVMPGGKTEQLSLKSAFEKFMAENIPKFKTESFTIPKDIVDFGGTRTQAPLFTDAEAENQELSVKNHRSFVRGEMSETVVFDFIKRSAENNQLAAFYSFKQAVFNYLMREDQMLDIFQVPKLPSQEYDFIIVTKSKKIIHIEVKGGESANFNTVKKALKQLEKGKTFIEKMVNIVGQDTGCKWEWIPVLAFPNVENFETFIELSNNPNLLKALKDQLIFVLTKNEL